MDRSPKGSRVRDWAAAAVVAISLAGVGYLVGRGPQPAPPPQPPEVTKPTPEPAVVPDPVLGRADLIGIAASAADAFAGGPKVSGSSAGRRFSIRMPFGCDGSSEKGFTTGWSYDEASKTLRVRVTPLDWSDEDWIASALPGEEEFVVEGFWLPRPWTSSETCPVRQAKPDGKDADSSEGPVGKVDEIATVGLAQFLGEDSNRNRQRRGRPLEVVANIEPDEIPVDGLQLVFEGRIGNVPGGRSPTLCHADSINVRPSCLVAVEFERISVLNPASGEEIANWRM
jgi:hypothetical protein